MRWATKSTPVQAYRYRAAGMPGLHGPDLRPLGDPLAGGDICCHRFIGGAQVPIVAHRHHTVAGHHPSEDHRACAGGEHRRAGYRSQVNTAVTWPVPEYRGLEGPYHGRRTGQRPAELLTGRPTSGRVVGPVMAGDPADSTATSMLQTRIRDTPAPCPRPPLPTKHYLPPLWTTAPMCTTAPHTAVWMQTAVIPGPKTAVCIQTAPAVGVTGTVSGARRLRWRPACGSTSRASAVPFRGFGVRRSLLRS
jgi:hypothetical protein